MTLDNAVIFAVGFAWGMLVLHFGTRARRKPDLEPGTCQCGHGRHIHRLGLYGCAELIAWELAGPGAARTCPCMHYIADPAAAPKGADSELEQLRRMARLEDRR